MTILVTDGEQRSALAAVRSLGRAGCAVHVVASRAGSLAGASRHASSETVLADSLRSPGAFAEGIEKLATVKRPDVILPVTEGALLALLPVRDRFEASIPFPSLAQFEAICDKARVLDLGRSVGIAVPGQRLVRSAEEGVGSWDAPFPVVLKPSRSVVDIAGKGRAKAGVSYAASRDELEVALRAIRPEAYPVLLQQRIEGPGLGMSVLVWGGRLQAAFAHRRLREKPPSGGVSVLRESVALDRSLLDRSLALLAQLGWCGVAMVEYKLDARTGMPYLMEINGRLWGSLQLAIDAGVDFPDLLVRLAVGERPESVVRYRVGTRTRWEWGDVDHLLARLRYSPRALSLPAGTPGRLRAVVDFVGGFAFGARAEVFRFDDPGPFLRESVDWICRR